MPKLHVIAGRVQTPGGVISDEGLWHISHQVSPALLAGFLIVQPKRHVEHLGELTTEEAQQMGVTLGKAAAGLAQVLSPEKVYVCSFGDLVSHLHFYLIPRSDDMSSGAPPLLFSDLGSGRWACSDETAAAVAVKVREALQDR